jgi:predicted acylesterase/phospholipase RssA
MLAAPQSVNTNHDKPILEISAHSAIFFGTRRLFHIVTMLAFTGVGSVGIFILCGYLPWIAITGTVLIAMASAVAVPSAVCLTLTLCLFCVHRSKKRALEKYTNLIRANPLATLPGNPDKKLLDCLNDEWEAVSWAALTQPKATVRETIMGDCFKNLQECKFAYELEMFRRFLRKDLTDLQRQKVSELEVEMRKRFDDEMKILSAPVYSPRMCYTTMIDFSIVLFDEAISEAIAAGLSDHKLPEHEVKIEHLSMCGGGSRGIAYVELLKKLKPTLIPDFKVSGTSAGAVAALVASFSLDDSAGLTHEMQKRCGDSAQATLKWEPAYEWLKPKFASWPSYYNFIGGLALFDQRVQEKVSPFLMNIEDAVIDATFPDDIVTQKRMRILRKRYDATVSREGEMVTFQDLGNIQKLPGGKEQFHDLATAVWDKTAQEVLIMKKETQPHMPVVLAVYASMSLPFFFKFLSIPLENSDGKPHQLLDGTYGAYLPIDAYSAAPEKTCGVVFDCDGSGGRTLCGKVKYLSKFLSWGARRFGIVCDSANNARDEGKRMHPAIESGQIFVLPNGDVGLMDLNISPVMEAAIAHQVDLRVKAWKICKTRGRHWPQSTRSTLIAPE